MATLTTQYVYFGASGAHTRQPRATGSYGGFTPIPGLNPGGTATLTAGTPFQAGPAAPTLTAGSLDLVFAFTNVSGCTEGGLNSFNAAVPPPVGTVGTSPINVMYVYVPEGGPGNGDSGAVIDAFNETTGSLVDNDFVTVSPDSGDELTDEANVDGWVDTEDSGYTIAADHPNIGSYESLSTSARFDQWVDLTNPSPPATLVSGADLTPGEGETVYALAFYKNPPPKSKEFIDKSWDVYKVQFEQLKGFKESVEMPGFGNIGDPEEFIGMMRVLNERLSRLENELEIRGSSFIRSEDRPNVGRRKREEPKER